uniref:Uncharacterized protein n=1 Tax=Lotharella globosa TaxID=91324 RepID=A0A7S4DMW5_9EUKA
MHPRSERSGLTLAKLRKAITSPKAYHRLKREMSQIAKDDPNYQEQPQMSGEKRPLSGEESWKEREQRRYVQSRKNNITNMQRNLKKLQRNAMLGGLRRKMNNYKIPRRDRNAAKAAYLDMLGKKKPNQSRPYAMGIGMKFKQEKREDLKDEISWIAGETPRKGLRKQKQREKAKRHEWGLRELGPNFRHGMLHMDPPDRTLRYSNKKKKPWKMPKAPGAAGAGAHKKRRRK